jgi:hypothetical protein
VGGSEGGRWGGGRNGEWEGVREVGAEEEDLKSGRE